MKKFLRKFQKTTEDFTCGHCGQEVTGSGYTNHCPRCLWSKHVDVNPGDRQSECFGMMEPVVVEQKKSGQHSIVHRCVVCGYEKKNKMARDDDFQAVLELAGRAQP